MEFLDGRWGADGFSVRKKAHAGIVEFKVSGYEGDGCVGPWACRWIVGDPGEVASSSLGLGVLRSPTTSEDPETNPIKDCRLEIKEGVGVLSEGGHDLIVQCLKHWQCVRLTLLPLLLPFLAQLNGIMEKGKELG